MANKNDSETMVVEEERETSEHSFWPVVVAVSSLLVGVGLLSTPVVSVLGAVVLMVAIIGWFTERWVS